MTRAVKTLIVDPDHFYVAGLQHAIKAHFQSRDIPVLFMGHPLSYPLADLIFWAPGHPATEMPTGLLTGHKRSRVILLMSQQRPHLAAYCVSRVFYRHRDCTQLASLIEMSIDTAAGAPIHTVTDAYAALLAALSPRQREVMGCVSQGLRLHDIAVRLHIHEKTVSTINAPRCAGCRWNGQRTCTTGYSAIPSWNRRFEVVGGRSTSPHLMHTLIKINLMTEIKHDSLSKTHRANALLPEPSGFRTRQRVYL